MQDLVESVKQLLQLVPRPPGTAIPGGATNTELEEFEAWLGYKVTPILQAWLRVSNGPCVGPGGLFGVGSAPRHLRIQHYLSLYSTWRERRWLPVAGDGCGNYYVLVDSTEFGRKLPVIFVEPIANPSEPSYIAASNLWSFLNFLLQKELSQSAWPFNKEEVVSRDPNILLFTAVRFPWMS